MEENTEIGVTPAEVMEEGQKIVEKVQDFVEEVVEAVKDEAELIEHNARDFLGLEENCVEPVDQPVEKPEEGTPIH